MAAGAPAPSPGVEASRTSFEQAEVLIAAGRFDEARAAAAMVARDNTFAVVYGAFVDGRIAQGTGNLRQAREIYRKVLNRAPELTRVRLHLAQVLAALGDVEAARHHYEFVLGDTINEQVSDRIRTDMRALDNHKRWSAQVFATIAPTTNMNSGTARSVVNLGGMDFRPTNNGRQKSGLGLSYGFDLGYSHPLAEDWNWLLTTASVHTDYQGRSFDDRLLRVTTGLQRQIDAGVISGEIVGQRRWFGGEGYYSAYGPLLTLRKFVSTHDRVTTQTSWLAQRYDETTYQNGGHFNLSTHWDRFVRPGQFIRFGAMLDIETTRKKHLDYAQYGALIGYNIELPYAVTLYPEASVMLRRYRGDFPLMSKARQDVKTIASLTLTKRDFDIFGVAPKITVALINTTSNVKFYQNQRIDFNFTMTKQY